jgi:hypothetical protein
MTTEMTNLERLNNARQAEYYYLTEDLVARLKDATDSYEVIDICFATMGKLAQPGFIDKCPVVDSVGCIELQSELIKLVYLIHNVLFCDDDIFEQVTRNHINSCIHSIKEQYNLAQFEASYQD